MSAFDEPHQDFFTLLESHERSLQEQVNSEVLMQKHVVKALIVTALGLGVPVMGFTIAKIAQSRFQDVPAGHWAQEAVDYVTAKGLITGFPDGTFKGQQTLSRYQAALIFYRLLQSGAMNNVDAGGQAVVNKGMEEVKAELDGLKTQLGALETTTKNQDGRLGTLEEQLKTMGAQSGSALEPRVKSLEDLLATLNTKLESQQAAGSVDPALQAKVTDLETQLAALRNDLKMAAPDAQQSARVAALEADIATLKSQAGNAPSADQASKLAELETSLSELKDQVSGLDSTELADRVTALEDQAKAVAAPIAAADLSPQVKALEDRIVALEGQVKTQPAGASPDQTAQITQLQSDLKTLQDQVKGIASASPANAAAADQGARVGALETQLKDLGARVDAIKPGGTDPALTDQIKAQEAKLADLQAKFDGLKPGTTDPALADQIKAQDAKLAELQAKVDGIKPGGTDPAIADQLKAQDEKLKTQDERIAALEGQVEELATSVTELSDKLAAQPTAPPVTTTPATPPTTTTPTTPVDITPTTPPLVTTPTTTTPAPVSSNPPNFYIGIGGRYGVIPSGGATNDNVALSVMVGFKRFLGPIGFRVSADYLAFATAPNPSNTTLPAKYFSVNPALVLDLGFLYLGAGVGGDFGLQNSLFVNGIVGINIAFSNNFGLFIEGDPRFYLNQASDKFRFGVRAGLKFSF
jgi:predicted  nucleic acid-binding Zn-ribbon protein